MAVELWGTFAVRDHQVERAFVADVLLYDRLVIPTPGGQSSEEWPKEWGADRQTAALDILEDLAIAIPWTEKRREQWQERFDSAQPEQRGAARVEANNEIEKYVEESLTSGESYIATRELLADIANQKINDELMKRIAASQKAGPGATVRAVAAYSSYDSLSRDMALGPADRAARAPARDGLALFRWKFGVPESQETSAAEDRKLLKKAVKLARKPEFIESRLAFNNWLDDMARNQQPPAEMTTDMKKRFDEYTKLMRAEKWKTRARWAIKVAGVSAGALGYLSRNPALAVGSGVAIGVVGLLADRRLERASVAPRLQPAAMCYEAKRLKLGGSI